MSTAYARLPLNALRVFEAVASRLSVADAVIVTLDELRHAWEGGLSRALGWTAADRGQR